MKTSQGSNALSQDTVDPSRILEAHNAVLFDLVVLSQVTNTSKAIIGVKWRDVCNIEKGICLACVECCLFGRALDGGNMSDARVAGALVVKGLLHYSIECGP